MPPRPFSDPTIGPGRDSLVIIGLRYPIPDTSPLLSMPRIQLGPGLVGPQQVAQLAGPLVIIAQLQSDVHTLKMASPIQPNPVTGTQPVWRRSVRFTNTEVPKFRGNPC